MSNDPNPHDEAIDKVLAALRAAAPPEGMQSRIAQRLRQHATTSAAASRLPMRLPARFTLAGAWWRGAISGAAAAALAAGVFVFATHLLRTNSIPAQTPKFAANQGPATPTIVPTSISVGVSAGKAQAHPCARQAVLRVQPATALPTEQRLLAETRTDTAAPSHPAPPLPLTVEERSLLQLAHTADPKALAAPDPETQAKLEAQEADEFQRFFSAPQNPTTKEDNKQN